MQIALLAAACATPKSRILQPGWPAQPRLAVLHVSVVGLQAGSASKLAEDALSQEFFIQQKGEIVEPGLVRAAAHDAGLSSASIFNLAQLKEVGQRLNVQGVIIGEIRNLGQGGPQMAGSNQHLFASMRLVDCANGRVIAVVSREKKTSAEPKEAVISLIRELVGDLRWQKPAEAENAME